jgi:hypothetical protein
MDTAELFMRTRPPPIRVYRATYRQKKTPHGRRMAQYQTWCPARGGADEALRVGFQDDAYAHLRALCVDHHDDSAASLSMLVRGAPHQALRIQPADTITVGIEDRTVVCRVQAVSMAPSHMGRWVSRAVVRFAVD